mmetsp:Transcript_76898/g.146319  ORF Transcript_76898/g.146319 Transcript_76898/m.146319 type:complete len:689 (+) Transcript_76898:72-2138(+)
MAVVRLAFVLSLLAASSCTVGAELQETAANPIRKVVTMLESMKSKVEAEGKKEAELYEKFMCYCKTGSGDLEKSIADATAKVPAVGSEIEESEAKLAQLKEDLMQHKKDRDAAKAAIEEADSLRANEKAEFDAYNAESSSNIAAINKAVTALEKGMSGSFLQTSTAQQVLKVVKATKLDMPEGDKDDLIAFFQGTQDSSYAPQAGSITGILKQLGDEMSADLAAAVAAEEEAVAQHAALVAAKKKEIAAATAAVEKKSVRIGNLGVEIATMKADLGDTEEALLNDKKFLSELEKDCDTKTAEWDEISKNRAAEEVALADTIKILNDDDALELFKKTLPAAGSSFMQMQVSKSELKAKAIAQLQKGRSFDLHRPQIDFILLAVRGQKIGFEKVIKMIDEMVATLKTEQSDDSHKKEYCETQFDLTEDKMKAAEQNLADLETSIADSTESIATVKSEIAATESGIKALDTSVAEATEQRKEQHAEFVELMAGDSQAKEILEFAKKRLQKFYTPKLYAATTFVQVAAHSHVSNDEKPAPPPPAPQAYEKSSSSGVINMIDLIIKDLDKEMQEAGVSEKDAQSDYEEMMADSATKRASDSKSLTELEAQLADLETSLQSFKDSKSSGTKELMGIKKYDSSLHAECDWLLKYSGVRKEARAGEIDSLEKAKAVLSGADYSLMQTRSRRFLKRA